MEDKKCENEEFKVFLFINLRNQQQIIQCFTNSTKQTRIIQKFNQTKIKLFIYLFVLITKHYRQSRVLLQQIYASFLYLQGAQLVCDESSFQFTVVYPMQLSEDEEQQGYSDNKMCNSQEIKKKIRLNPDNLILYIYLMENRLEKNVNKLIERYKKTSQQLEQIIQTEEIISPPVTLYQTRPQQSRINFNDEESSSREKKNHSIEQISRLRETLNAKELQEKEKQERLRILNKELKMTLKDYIKANRDLEVKVNQREKHIKSLEYELKSIQDQFSKVENKVKENRQKCEGQEKLIEELQQQQYDSHQKLLLKKDKIQLLKEQLKQQETQFDEQGQNFAKELERVQRQCEDFSSEIKNQEALNRELEEEKMQLLEETQQKEAQITYFDQLVQDFRFRDEDNLKSIEYLNEELQYQKAQTQQYLIKFEECQEKLKQVSENTQETLINLEKESKKYQDQFQDILNQKKQKSNQNKLKIEELQQTILDLQRKIDNDEKNRQIQEYDFKNLQQFSNELKQVTDQQAIKLLNQEEKNQSLHLEISKQMQINSNLLSQIKQMEQKSSQEQRMIEQLKDDNQNLSDSVVQLQNYIRNLEEDHQECKQQHDKQIDEIEKKIDNLVESALKAKEQLQEYIQRENELKQKVKQSEFETQKQQEKCQKYKQQLQSLRHTIKNVEMFIYFSWKINSNNMIVRLNKFNFNRKNRLNCRINKKLKFQKIFSHQQNYIKKIDNQFILLHIIKFLMLTILILTIFFVL